MAYEPIPGKTPDKLMKMKVGGKLTFAVADKHRPRNAILHLRDKGVEGTWETHRSGGQIIVERTA